MIATGSWSGGAKVWDVPGLNEVKALKGECCRCHYAAVALEH